MDKYFINAHKLLSCHRDVMNSSLRFVISNKKPKGYNSLHNEHKNYIINCG